MRTLKLRVAKADRGERLDHFLARAGGVSRGEIRRTLERGGVWLDERRIRIASRPVREGEQYLVSFARPSATTAPRTLAVLYEDDWLVAVDKPPFLDAQPTLSDSESLLALVSDHVGMQVGLVHRLDRMTSGVTVFGKRAAATRGLAEAFREGTARKRYQLLARGALPDVIEVDRSIGPDPTRKGRYRSDPPEIGRGLPAWTRFELRGRLGDLLAVEAFPRTGRTHQLRVHLAAVGAPILGDTLYGGPSTIEWMGEALPVGRVLLHARELTLEHPGTGATLRLEAPLPEDMALLWTGISAKNSTSP